jgi:hypothetical protein
MRYRVLPSEIWRIQLTNPARALCSAVRRHMWVGRIASAVCAHATAILGIAAWTTLAGAETWYFNEVPRVFSAPLGPVAVRVAQRIPREARGIYPTATALRESIESRLRLHGIPVVHTDRLPADQGVVELVVSLALVCADGRCSNSSQIRLVEDAAVERKGLTLTTRAVTVTTGDYVTIRDASPRPGEGAIEAAWRLERARLNALIGALVDRLGSPSSHRKDRPNEGPE